MNKKIYPPSVFLKDELEARSERCKCCGHVRRFQQQDLSVLTGIAERTISEIVNNKRPITLKTAKKLAKGLGTSIELWLNLQHEWDMSQLNSQRNY